jgi:integrase
MARGGLNMKKLHFNSKPMGKYLNRFITFKQTQGCAYIRSAEWLCKFDDFLVLEEYDKSYLNAEILDRYIAYTEELSSSYQRTCLIVVKVFSKYLASIFPESAVLYTHYKRYDNLRFYLYSEREVLDLIEATAKLKKTQPLLPQCMHYLIGLLFSTGLRISEALSLRLYDVDLLNKRVLVRKGKFNKDRYVPLDSSVTEKIQQWYDIRGTASCRAASSKLFVTSRQNKPLKYFQASNAFSTCRKQCGLHHIEPLPRLHDFRHTYACNCIVEWRRRGVDINAKLPILATVLGHVDFMNTQIYLHATQAQLTDASVLFHDHISKNGGLS